MYPVQPSASFIEMVYVSRLPQSYAHPTTIMFRFAIINNNNNIDPNSKKLTKKVTPNYPHEFGWSFLPGMAVKIGPKQLPLA